MPSKKATARNLLIDDDDDDDKNATRTNDTSSKHCHIRVPPSDENLLARIREGHGERETDKKTKRLVWLTM